MGKFTPVDERFILSRLINRIYRATAATASLNRIYRNPRPRPDREPALTFQPIGHVHYVTPFVSAIVVINSSSGFRGDRDDPSIENITEVDNDCKKFVPDIVECWWSFTSDRPIFSRVSPFSAPGRPETHAKLRNVQPACHVKFRLYKIVDKKKILLRYSQRKVLDQTEIVVFKNSLRSFLLLELQKQC